MKQIEVLLANMLLAFSTLTEKKNTKKLLPIMAMSKNRNYPNTGHYSFSLHNKTIKNFNNK